MIMMTLFSALDSRTFFSSNWLAGKGGILICLEDSGSARTWGGGMHFYLYKVMKTDDFSTLFPPCKKYVAPYNFDAGAAATVGRKGKIMEKDIADHL